MTVTNVVQQSMNQHGFSSYINQARPVIEDVDRWVAECCDRLMQYGREQGVSQALIRTGLEVAGFIDGTPSLRALAQPGGYAHGGFAQAGQPSTEDRLTRIEEAVDRLTDLASQYTNQGSRR